MRVTDFIVSFELRCTALFPLCIRGPHAFDHQADVDYVEGCSKFQALKVVEIWAFTVED